MLRCLSYSAAPLVQAALRYILYFGNLGNYFEKASYKGSASARPPVIVTLPTVELEMLL